MSRDNDAGGRDTTANHTPEELLAMARACYAGLDATAQEEVHALATANTPWRTPDSESTPQEKTPDRTQPAEG